jgi:hypothetical protein
MAVPARISIVTIFADPDGHVWEVCYNPSFPIGPDGRITID